MLDLGPASYRVLLLASVAGVALGATGAHATNYSNSSPTTNAGPSYSLQSGDTLNNSSSVTSTGAGQPAVTAGGGASSIVNSGLIQASGANGIGIQVVSGGSVGTITNGGTVQTANGGNPIVVQSGGTLGGTILSAGSIGSLANSGLIQSSGTDAAIAINPTASIGSIINTGTVQSGGVGSGIAVAGTLGSLNNSGAILSPQGTAIAIASTGTVPGGVTNSGLIQGGPSNGSGVAIDNSAGGGALTINNSGTVIGAIKLGPYGDTLNVTGGAITGAIIGLAGSNDIVNFSPTGTFTTGGPIANVDTINVNSNTLVLNNPVTAAQAFNVAAGAVTDLNANVGANSFRNAGLVNIGTSTPTISGNYTQTSTGALGVTVTNSSSGKLTVTGSATVQGGSETASVHIPSSDNLLLLSGQSWDILHANTLTTNGSLTAVGDISGITFSLTDSSTDLFLNALTLTTSQAQTLVQAQLGSIFNPVIAGGFFSGPDPRLLSYLTALETQLVASGPAGQQYAARINSVLLFLLNDGPPQVQQALRQLAPSNLSTSALTLALASNSLNIGLSSVDGRLTVARLDPSQSGLAAGDAVGRGFTFWGQPYGAYLNQDAKDGFDPYTIASYGATFGADTLLTPELRVGAAVTLGNSNVWYSGLTSGSNGDIFTSQFALYGQWFRNNFFVDALLSFAYNHYDRHDGVLGFGISLDSNSGGTDLGAKIGAGYDWHVGKAVITPYASVQQLHFNFDGYTTSGGSFYALDEHVNGQSFDVTQTRIGARVSYPVNLPGGGSLIPEFHAYYVHDFGQDQLDTTFFASDVPGAGPAVLTGPKLDRGMLNVGISASLARGPGWRLIGGYDYTDRASSNAHILYVNVKIDY